MKKSSKIQKKIALVTALALTAILSVSFASSRALGYEIEKIDVSGAIYKDFVIGPGKVEIEIKPGESKTTIINVSNRMGIDRRFKIETEDFTGSSDPNQTVVLLGSERGPYSLKDFVHVSEKTFDLKSGERAKIPVTISIPTDAEPGGLYGSVLVSTVSTPTSGQAASAVVSRLGTLIFVKIPGEIEYDGKLVSFETKSGKKLYDKGPIGFRLLYENKSSVHVNPYGEIRITNILGEEVGKVEVTPWFAMPGSLRLREVSWDREFLFGKYTATANINRGYDDIIDTVSYTFFVLPLKIIVAIIVICILIVLGLRFIITRFEIRKKK